MCGVGAGDSSTLSVVRHLTRPFNRHGNRAFEQPEDTAIAKRYSIDEDRFLRDRWSLSRAHLPRQTQRDGALRQKHTFLAQADTSRLQNSQQEEVRME